MNKSIKFKSPYSEEVANLQVELKKYANGQNAIQLWEEGMPYLTASVAVNVPGEAVYPIEENDVVIKNYSENAGVLEALIEGGVIEPPHAEVGINFVTLYVCKLNQNKMK